MDTTHFKNAQAALKTALTEDIEWLSHGRVAGQKPDPIMNPWMPFQAADFLAILAECVAQAEPSGHVDDRCSFLDVGSGIGTKMLLADKVFGLDAYGIEIDREMALHAGKAHGMWTYGDDALKWSDYYRFDIIWMYRPFRDTLKQLQLEHRIYEDMKPGAIIAGAGLVTPPNGFEIIVDDWDLGCQGAWKKPLDWEPVTYDLNEDDDQD